MVHQATVDVSKHKIERVEIFHERSLAKVQRYVQVDLGVGQNEITFNQLPNAIVKDSVRVEAIDNSFTVDITRVETGSLYQTPVNPDDPVQKEINELTRQTDENTRELNTYEDIEKKLRKGLKDDANVQDLREWLDIYTEKRTEYTDKIADLRAKNDALWKQIDELRLQASKDWGSKKGTEITVSVKSDVACTTALELSYMVSATWTPFYEVFVTTRGKGTDSNPVRVAYRAYVSQITGEDWEDVVLTLSTTAGAKNPNSIPTYCPVPVQPIRAILPPPVNSSVESLAYAPPLPCVTPLPLCGLSPPTCTYGSCLCCGYGSTSHGSYEPFQFVLDGRVTVKSQLCTSSNSFCPGINNHTTSMFSIIDMDLSSKLEWIAEAVIGSNVYVQCHVENSSPHPLLAGKAKIHVDDTYHSTISIAKTMPNGKISFRLLDDTNFEVIYQPFKDVEVSGFWKKRFSKDADIHANDVVTVKYHGTRAVGPLVVKGRTVRTWMRSEVLEPANLPPREDNTEVQVAPGLKARWFIPGVPSASPSGISVPPSIPYKSRANSIEFIRETVRPGDDFQLVSKWKETGRRHHIRK